MVVINKDTYIIYREKLDNGQIVHLEFSKYTTLKRTFYFVCLFINKRKKGYIENEQTGKCGLSGLIIAKNLLIKGRKNIYNYRIYQFEKKRCL